MSTYSDRETEAAEAVQSATDRLIDAGRAYCHGAYSFAEINEAIHWTAIQCDFEADDYETLEATMLARLDDADKTGER